MSAITYRIVSVNDQEDVDLDGFDFDGIFIHNPFVSDNGFHEVDPREEYGKACEAFLARHPDGRSEIGDSVDMAYAIEVE